MIVIKLNRTLNVTTAGLISDDQYNKEQCIKCSADMQSRVTVGEMGPVQQMESINNNEALTAMTL